MASRWGLQHVCCHCGVIWLWLSETTSVPQQQMVVEDFGLSGGEELTIDKLRHAGWCVASVLELLQWPCKEHTLKGGVGSVMFSIARSWKLIVPKIWDDEVLSWTMCCMGSSGSFPNNWMKEFNYFSMWSGWLDLHWTKGKIATFLLYFWIFCQYAFISAKHENLWAVFLLHFHNCCTKFKTRPSFSQYYTFYLIWAWKTV